MTWRRRRNLGRKDRRMERRKMETGRQSILEEKKEDRSALKNRKRQESISGKEGWRKEGLSSAFLHHACMPSISVMAGINQKE